MSAAWWIGYVYISAFTWRRPAALISSLTVGLRSSSAVVTSDMNGKQQLIQLGDVAVAEEERAPVLRIEPRRQVVQYRLAHVGTDGVGRVTVGEHLVVRDDDERRRAQVLDAHAVGQRAEQMADVQRRRSAAPR